MPFNVIWFLFVFSGEELFSTKNFCKNFSEDKWKGWLTQIGLLFFPGSQSVQLLGYVRLFATPWTEALQASLSITSSQSLLSTSFQEVFSDSASKNLPTLDTRRITAFFVLEIVRKLSYLVPEEVLSISIL